jgi:hypothetical protein
MLYDLRFVAVTAGPSAAVDDHLEGILGTAFTKYGLGEVKMARTPFTPKRFIGESSMARDTTRIIEVAYI